MITRQHDLVDRVLYSNRDLDSWDIENLKYIRKISIRDSSETSSYVSNSTDEDKLDKRATHNNPFVQSSPNTSPRPHNYHYRPHPPPSAERVLEEVQLPKIIVNHHRPPEYSCYLMDVLLVANESVPSPSVSSADSFASAIRKGFFDMENNETQQIRKNHDSREKCRIKKSVSFMEESIHMRHPRITTQYDGRMMRRSGSFMGTTGRSDPKKYSEMCQFHTDNPIGNGEISVPWNGKLMGSDTLQLGYANNWAHLETYVQHLQHSRNSL